MKIRFMAGEMARLHNISKQTLIYYDRIGLFTPEDCDKETGYRYYGLGQCEDLDVILCLKNLGMSLKEIEEYVKSTTISERVRLLENQEDRMRKKIDTITRAGNRLHAIVSSLKERIEIQPFEVGIKRCRERFIICEEVGHPFDEYQLELAIKKLLKTVEKRDDTGAYELLVRVETSSSGSTIFKTAALEVTDVNCKAIAAGDYAYIYHKGTIQSLKDSRQKLMEYIHASGYQAVTNVTIEKVLLDALAGAKDDGYLIEVQVLIERENL